MRRLFLLLFLSTALAAVSILQPVFSASFGITPPYIRNDGLIRGSKFEQKIIIVRGDPSEELKVDISVNVPKAEKWISVDRGNSFILPKGESQFPINFFVSVPKDAEFGNYKGNILIRVSSAEPPQAGTVGIVLGAQVDVDLAVIDKKIFDFRITDVNVADLSEGRKFLWMFFPGKIRFRIGIENLGNVPAAPSKVVFEIYNDKGELLETTRNTNRLRPIPAFEFGKIEAELPTRLKPGSYLAKFFIYKENDVLNRGELSLSILPRGILPDKGYGIDGLSRRDKTILAAAVLPPVAGILYGIFYLLRRIFKKIRRRRQK